MAHEILLTPEGHAKLKKELEDLKGPERMRVAEAIREAKSHGDLRENAAYHEAKLNQQRLEARIAELEKALQIAKIVDSVGDSSVANLGSKVTLEEAELDEVFTVELVGDFESDPSRDLISIGSPLGTALKGRAAGDNIEVKTPNGVQTYRIVSIE